jgi:hypothetical protein
VPQQCQVLANISYPKPINNQNEVCCQCTLCCFVYSCHRHKGSCVYTPAVPRLVSAAIRSLGIWHCAYSPHYAIFLSANYPTGVGGRSRCRLVRAAAEDEQKQAQVAAAEASKLDLPFESELSDMQTFSGGSTPGGGAAGSSLLGPSECSDICSYLIA